MFRRVAYLAVPAVVLASLAGCAGGLFNFERREAWRAEADKACMSEQRAFRRDDGINEIRAIRDQGVCGLERPLEITALADGSVQIGPTATINCPMTVALERWIGESVQDAAVARLGVYVVGIDQMSDYSCRTKNSQPGAELSEHAFGNAFDIGAFVLSDGRELTIKDHWTGGTQAEKDFLREILATSCQYFTTVLGPGSNIFHYDHFHFDLARHNADGTSHYCRPEINIPPRPETLPLLADRPGLFGLAEPETVAPATPAAAEIEGLIQALGM